MKKLCISHLQSSDQEQIRTAGKRLAVAKTTTETIKQKEILADLLEQNGLHDNSRILWNELVQTNDHDLYHAMCLRKITASFINQRDHESAAAKASLALKIIRQTPLKSQEEIKEYFQILNQSCFAFYFCLQSEKVEECVKELRKLLSSIDNLSQQIDFYFSVSLHFLMKYRWYQLPEEAVSHCQFYMHLAKQNGNPATIAMAITGNAFVHLWREEITESRTLFKEAIKILDEKNYGFLMICYTYIAIGYRMQNNVSMTELWSKITIEKAEKTGNKVYLAICTANMAWVYATRKNWLYAEDYAKKSFDFLMKGIVLYYLSIFPLLDALLQKNNTNEAGKYTFFLLHPKAKRLPPLLTNKIKKFTSSWVSGNCRNLEDLLSDIIFEAKTSGYY
ncbi:MAG: hypothetical protein LH615_09255 [Ferruginibacter sp.]|nr:hypothetical protein [Ferruginibacter sp.]